MRKKDGFLGNIYKLDDKGLKEIINQFYATSYGRSIFWICYIVPLFLIVITMGLFVNFILFKTCDYILIGLSFLSMNYFCVASYLYYRELRMFAQKNK